MKHMLFAGLVTVSLAARADTHYVKAGNAAPAAPYTTKATAARFIGQAVGAASDGDIILVATGTYILASQVMVNKSVTVRALGSVDKTVVDGNNSTRCFYLNKAGAKLDGLTITRGRASAGGGVYCQKGTVVNCTVISNTAIGLEPLGGGVYSRGLTKNCEILYNTAVSTNPAASSNFAHGGGIYCFGGAIEDTWIYHNTGSANYVWGGGVSITGGRMTYSSPMNNSATAYRESSGGGVCAQGGAVIERCWISGNVAEATETGAFSTASADGGGIHLSNGSSARNSLIINNTARSNWGSPSGGGAWVSGSTLFHCTLHGNQAVGGKKTSKGGGVMWGPSSVCQGTIIWANTSNSGNHSFLGSINEVAFSYTCTDFVPPGPGNQFADPLFVNTGFFNFQLIPNSPCIDAARPATTYTCDLDGRRRPLDGDSNGTAIADIGCYEMGEDMQLPAYDFDGDGRTDPAVMRAANGKFRILMSETWRVWNSTAGNKNWKPACSDYDGDKRTDPAWFDPATGRWHILASSSDYAERTPKLGTALDLPVPADFDGDGKADLAVRRASDGKITVRNSSDLTTWTTGPGNKAWIATPADYDGDGKADMAWYKPGSPGEWRIYQSGNLNALLQPMPTFPGGLNDLPIAGDFDGDGKTDRAVFMPATGRFRVKESESGQAWTSAIGNPAWKPAPGDYNGDGLTDCGWYNPATGRFVVLYSDTNNADNSTANHATLPAFGAAPGDQPVVYQRGK